jgi:hypothetical protein
MELGQHRNGRVRTLESQPFGRMLPSRIGESSASADIPSRWSSAWSRLSELPFLNRTLCDRGNLSPDSDGACSNRELASGNRGYDRGRSGGFRGLSDSTFRISPTRERPFSTRCIRLKQVCAYISNRNEDRTDQFDEMEDSFLHQTIIRHAIRPHGWWGYRYRWGFGGCYRLKVSVSERPVDAAPEAPRSLAAITGKVDLVLVRLGPEVLSVPVS